MAKKGQQYTCPPKRFQIPADLKALGGSGNTIIGAVRSWVNSVNSRSRKTS